MLSQQLHSTQAHSDHSAIAAAFARQEYHTVEALCRSTLDTIPTDYQALLHLGISLGKLGCFSDASDVFQQALATYPDDYALHTSYVLVLGQQLRWQEAYMHAKRATEIAPERAAGWINLSYPCLMEGYISEGVAAAQRALSLTDDRLLCAAAWSNLGLCRREQGKLHAALEALEKSLELEPGNDKTYTSMLLTLQSDASATPEQFTAVAKKFAETFERPYRDQWPVHGEKGAEPWRKLRIGLLSPDFCNHPVMYFVEGLLTCLDRRQFELYALNLTSAFDAVRERVQRFADHWVSLDGMGPSDQAGVIIRLGIDIVIDLAGHTSNNGLLALARKPAPVQMTWLGYPGTTGLSAINWRITDDVADPPGSEHQYSEQLARMPAPFCVYRPCIRNPLDRYFPNYQVRPTPALENGYITFGCCNTLAKLTENVLATWGRLLQRLPEARLLIEGRGLDDPETLATFKANCRSAGLPLGRMEFHPRENRNQYLTYHRIDIALDPFPLTGGTTSLDLLWMGLPLVTMQGNSFRSRMGTSLLTAAGLTEWVAGDEEEYINIAVRLASDTAALNIRRLQQRRLIEQSPLMNAPRFAHLFGELLRRAWLHWCAQQVAADVEAQRHQIQQWMQERPCLPPTEPLIFLAPGEAISLTEARKRMQEALQAARTEADHGAESSQALSPAWQSLTYLAVLVLESIPKEPVALAMLAEAEYSHQNRFAALCYMSHAADAAPDVEEFAQRLALWHREEGNEQAAYRILALLETRRQSASREAAEAAYRTGDSEPLERLCKQLLHKDASDVFACFQYSEILINRQQYQEAIQICRTGLLKEPDNWKLHVNLSTALGRVGWKRAAYEHARQATRLNPAELIGWLNLSGSCALLDLYQEGEQAARIVLQSQPANYYAWNNLANCLRGQGMISDAIGAYCQTLALAPEYDIAHTNLLLTMQSDSTVTVQQIVQTARDYGQKFEEPLKSRWPATANSPIPWRRLKVGLLSPDYNDHSAMYFIEPVLAQLNRKEFELYCYYLLPEGLCNTITTRVQCMADRFVFLGNMPPEEQARVIQDDGIDILIDLAGHTAKSGLLTMARKPAPVQVTWLGYPGTTGLSAIDWRITDTVADKEVEELKVEGLNEEALQGVPPLKEQYSEKLAFLPPPFCVYRPCIRNPLQRYRPQYQVCQAPAVINGYVTFGSCNNLAKLTPNVLETWGRLLQRLPTARLLIEGKGFDNPEAVQNYRKKCVEHGIDSERLDLISRETKNQYLTYHQIDIALDPFPLTGGTTSFDLLWMGLPLVTMQGISFRSRMSISLLTAAGLTEWIAKNEDEYIEIAAKLASDISSLNAQRLAQRRRIEAGPLMNEPRFVRMFEEALRQMWLKWCAEKVAPENSPEQFQQWLQERPQQQPAEPQVFLAPGDTITLHDARIRLNELMEETKGTQKSSWQDVMTFATLMLDSMPGEPLALAALAEVDYHHGHLQSAISFMGHALNAAPHMASFYHRLATWCREAGNEQESETINQLLRQRIAAGEKCF